MTIEPEWMDLTSLGSPYEEQLDVRAAKPTYRHRVRSFSGEVEGEWIPGAPPPVAPDESANTTP